MRTGRPSEAELQEAAEALGVPLDAVDDVDVDDIATEIVARRLVVNVRLQLLANGLDPELALDVARYLAREPDAGEGDPADEAGAP